MNRTDQANAILADSSGYIMGAMIIAELFEEDGRRDLFMAAFPHTEGAFNTRHQMVMLAIIMEDAHTLLSQDGQYGGWDDYGFDSYDWHFAEYFLDWVCFNLDSRDDLTSLSDALLYGGLDAEMSAIFRKVVASAFANHVRTTRKLEVVA